MPIPNILMTRVDNRLVHGQVGVSWVNTLGVNLVVVSNDEASTDTLQQNLMDMVVPEGVGIRYFSLEKTINIIHKAAPHQKIFIVVKTPQDALTLVKGGVPIKELNIGNMHYEPGKTKLSATVFVSDDDISTFKELNSLGVFLEIRGIPNEVGKNLMELLDK